jgi:hypothetical protein
MLAEQTHRVQACVDLCMQQLHDVAEYGESGQGCGITGWPDATERLADWKPAGRSWAAVRRVSRSHYQLPGNVVASSLPLREC